MIREFAKDATTATQRAHDDACQALALATFTGNNKAATAAREAIAALTAALQALQKVGI